MESNFLIQRLRSPPRKNWRYGQTPLFLLVVGELVTKTHTRWFNGGHKLCDAHPLSQRRVTPNYSDCKGNRDPSSTPPHLQRVVNEYSVNLLLGIVDREMQIPGITLIEPRYQC